ncbi:MAG: hypothetical protein AB7N76_29810 [Planctomycetota bacterium]
MKNTRDWTRAATQEIDVITQQVRRYEQARAAHLGLETELETRIGPALECTLDELLAGGVLTPEGVRAAATWTGCDELRAMDPQQAIATRQGELQAQLRALEQDELWPRVADELPALQAELEEKRDERAEPARFVRRSLHPRRDTLLENGYGTPDYQGEWWRLSYYSDWKAGDEILENFPKFEEFGPWAEEYRHQRNQLTKVEGDIARLEGEVTELTRLQQSHCETEQRLGAVEKDVADEVREALKRHVAVERQAAFAGRLPDDSPQATRARQWIGTRKQLAYLRDLRVNHLDPFGKRCRTGIDKLRRKIAKYGRPKNAGARFSDEEFARTFADRAEKYEKFWKVYELAFAALRDFQRYDYGRFDDDFLWWDLIAAGRIRCRWSEEVQRFHDAHPGYRWEQPWDEDDEDYYDDEAEAAAATIGADDYYDGGYDAS